MDKDKLMELIEQVQSLAPEVWGVYLRQQYIEAAGSVGLIAVLVGFVYLVWSQRQADWFTDRTMGVSSVGLFASVGAFIAVTFAVIVGWEAFLHIANPEYQAIQELLP